MSLSDSEIEALLAKVSSKGEELDDAAAMAIRGERGAPRSRRTTSAVPTGFFQRPDPHAGDGA